MNGDSAYQAQSDADVHYAVLPSFPIRPGGTSRVDLQHRRADRYPSRLGQFARMVPVGRRGREIADALYEARHGDRRDLRDNAHDEGGHAVEEDRQHAQASQDDAPRSLTPAR